MKLATSSTGFKKLVREGISIEASVPRTLEDKLEIGEVGAMVNVIGGESSCLNRNRHHLPPALVGRSGVGSDLDAKLHATTLH